METLGGIAVAGIIWVGGSQVVAGETTPGTFFIYNSPYYGLPTSKISCWSKRYVTKCYGSSTKSFFIIDNKTNILDKGDKDIGILDSQKIKTIYLKDINFRYTSSKRLILKNISIMFEHAKKTAIVGPSGAGKTSLLNLLPRFYDLQKGEILINDTNIKKFSLKDLRNLFSLVSQDVVLFDNTIKYNIQYGSPNKKLAEIIRASKKAGCHGFISKLPNGYETEIGENGVMLSGGQRQRLSIARAFLKNAPFLLLDEATSSLDTESESKIQIALDKLMIGKTVLIIAHRLSTVKNSDQIIVMNNGLIVDKGSHSKLIKTSILYKTLYKNQLR